MEMQRIVAEPAQKGRTGRPLFWLSDKQLAAIAPLFPRPRGVARADDRRVVSGIVHVLRWGLEWRDAPAAYGPPKTLYNRFVRWSEAGHFDRIFMHLTDDDRPGRPVVDAAHLWTHGTAGRLLAMGHFPEVTGASRSAADPLD